MLSQLVLSESILILGLLFPALILHGGLQLFTVSLIIAHIKFLL
jgi:hypothetical protein